MIPATKVAFKVALKDAEGPSWFVVTRPGGGGLILRRVVGVWIPDGPLPSFFCVFVDGRILEGERLASSFVPLARFFSSASTFLIHRRI
jgi:hypothetical protein